MVIEEPCTDRNELCEICKKAREEMEVEYNKQMRVNNILIKISCTIIGLCIIGGIYLLAF
jgi:hypothetical protein